MTLRIVMNFLTIIYIYCLQFSLIEASVQEFVSGNNIFAAAIYKQIAKTNNENILISPFSIEIILALAQSGAKGETGQEIRTHLHLPKSKEETELTIRTLLPSLKNSEYNSLHTAHKIYVVDGLHVKEKFLKVATETYRSEVENIDFTKPEAADIMNKWIEKQTNNKIRNIISSNDLTSDTAAIFLNALYFKGDWLIPFSNYSTTKQKFYKTSQDIVEVDMMKNYMKHYRYYEDKELDAQFLELPFKGQNMSMVIVLPNQKDGISNLEDQIDNVFTERNFRDQLLILAIPKFKFEQNIDLNIILSNLGIKKGFDSTQADFSEIAGEKGEIYINKVKQQTYININEIGVEATGFTFLEMVLVSAPVETHKNFIADHPFIFYIKFGKLILFAGRVSVPSSAANSLET